MPKKHRDTCDVSGSIEGQHVDDAETVAVNEKEITELVGDASKENRAHTQKLLEFSDDSQAVINEIRVETLNKIRRLRPPVKAHGGKYYLSKKIVPILLTAPQETNEYLECCVFGGSVFLTMPRFRREILGDVNPGVVDLWRTLSHEQLSAALSERLSSIPYERSIFEEARRETGGSTVDRALRFLIKCRFSRGGLGTSFAWSKRKRGGRPGDENAWHTFRQTALANIIDRARGVEVTNELCWWTVWESREKMQRLIYADPPYMRKTRSAKKAYGPYEMTTLQHFWLVSGLRAHSGPAAISGYRCDEYDRWLRDWRRFDFEMPNNAGQTRRKQRRTESLWINW